MFLLHFWVETHTKIVVVLLGRARLLAVEYQSACVDSLNYSDEQALGRSFSYTALSLQYGYDG